MDRVLKAARLHAIHPALSLGMPWVIVSLSFAINVAIWHLTPAGAEGDGFTGGILALYITVSVGYVMAVTQILPFAMGLSLSRRAFYLGTALFILVESLLYGVALSILVAIENATNGWGAGLDYWAPGPFEMDNPVLQVFASGAPMLAFAFIGVGMGVVHQRYGQAGTWGLIVGTTVLFGALAILITWLDAWGSVASWFADQSVITLTVGLPMALAAIVALASYPGIRRVVP